MRNNETAVEMPATEVVENIQVEESGLQMEELESLVAPSAVWGT